MQCPLITELEFIILLPLPSLLKHEKVLSTTILIIIHIYIN